MRMSPTPLAAALALALPGAAQAQASAAIASGKAQPSALAPSEIVAAAPAADWVAIAPSDLLVMTLAPNAAGKSREVVIQLMPPPFSQGWIGNVRKLAATHWWDGTSVNRVQDNYVVQWGDPDAEDKAKAKALPAGLRANPESEYQITGAIGPGKKVSVFPLTALQRNAWMKDYAKEFGEVPSEGTIRDAVRRQKGDSYALETLFLEGWPAGMGPTPAGPERIWPVHCYGMVGVGRDLSPDTGSGAELYTVIGHAPRHLDRNIALVGRVIEGIEHLSSLPRGTLPLGVYDIEKGEQRVPIQSIRLATELPATEQPRFEYLSTESDSFARYADARANRRDPFFNVPAGGADICNIPVPVRRAMKH